MTGKNMRLWLMMTSLAAIIVVNAVLALVLTRSVTLVLLQREGEVTQEFLSGVLTAEGTAAKLFEAPAPNPALASFAAHVRSLPGTIRANIYSPDGYIRHSTEPNLVGLQFQDNEELADSFKGELVSKLEEVSESDKAEHIALNRLLGEEVIEAYIPVKNAGGEVMAVVEYYRSADMIKATVATIRNTIWLSAALSGLILFLALTGFALVSRKFGKA